MRYTVGMPATIKQLVTVRPGGLIEIRSQELREGDQAEVTVVVVPRGSDAQTTSQSGGWRRFAGAIRSGDPHAGDNDRLDADLAADYLPDPKDEA